MVYVLLRRFLTDYMLQNAHNQVTRAQQWVEEGEASFSGKFSRDSKFCRHVFRKADFFNYNYYVSGLKPSVGEMVSQNIRLVPATDRRNFASVTQAYVEIGCSHISMVAPMSTYDGG